MKLLRHGLLALLIALLILQTLGRTNDDFDYYKILGIQRSATEKQIKNAYRKMAVKYHPDKNPGDQNAADMFKKVAEAYEALRDQEKRRLYDMYGKAGLSREQESSGFDAFDLFSRFSGFGFGGRHHEHEKRGPDVEIKLRVELQNLYLGKIFEVDMSKQIICPHCRGSGAKDNSDVHTCESCHGHGVKIVKQMIAPGFVQQFQMACDECGGKGKIVKSTCPICNGAKVQRANSQITIQVEKGMKEGHKITFEREGDQSPDYTPGDVTFYIETLPHSIFTRRGDNLYTKMAIGLIDALVGFKREIVHLDGKKVVVERDGVTQSGHTMTIPEAGMPIHNYPSTFGDLFVEFQVIFPEKLSVDEKNALQQIFRKS